MDKRTKLAALQMLAKAAAELAADIATTTSEAAGLAHRDNSHELPLVAANLIVGTLMPAEQALEELTAVLKAVRALHQSRAV